MLFLLTDSPHKLKSEKIHTTLLCKPEFSSTTKTFFIKKKKQKKTTLQQVTGGKTLNLALKMLELFLKIQENIRISILKRRLRNLYKKENIKPEIKPMIENLQDEPSQFENKQAKSVKLRANIRWELEGKKCSKTFFKLKDRICKIKQYLNYIYR